MPTVDAPVVDESPLPTPWNPPRFSRIVGEVAFTGEPPPMEVPDKRLESEAWIELASMKRIRYPVWMSLGCRIALLVAASHVVGCDGTGVGERGAEPSAEAPRAAPTPDAPRVGSAGAEAVARIAPSAPVDDRFTGCAEA